MDSLNGKQTCGFHNAARMHYGKDVNKLIDDEYLSLVAMLIAPKGFSILENKEKNIERVFRIKSIISGEYVPKGLTDEYYNRR